jgi:nucleoid DNA-binding protein
MTLTKENIIGAVSDRTGFSKKKSRHTVNTLVEIIKSRLESGEDIKLSHFGKFNIKEKKARRWRSPFTNEIIMLPPKRVVTFKSFKRLKDRLNAESIGIEQSELSQSNIPTTPAHPLKPAELKKMLNDHRRWLESEGQKGQKANLAYAKLKEADLYGAHLSRINLQGADLQGADLCEADLYEADLQDADLDDAILEWASLDGAKLQRASLHRADLRWANLEGTNMEGANLRFANLEGANLKGAKLSEADLYGANLNNTDMVGAILTQIKLDYETQLNLPKVIFDKYRQTFQILEWSPAMAVTQ